MYLLILGVLLPLHLSQFLASFFTSVLTSLSVTVTATLAVCSTDLAALLGSLGPRIVGTSTTSIIPLDLKFVTSGTPTGIRLSSRILSGGLNSLSAMEASRDIVSAGMLAGRGTSSTF